MFLLMMLGLLLARKGLLTERGSGDLANILLYTVVPCVVIRSYITEYTPEKLRGLPIDSALRPHDSAGDRARRGAASVIRAQTAAKTGLSHEEAAPLIIYG